MSPIYLDGNLVSSWRPGKSWKAAETRESVHQTLSRGPVMLSRGLGCEAGGLECEAGPGILPSVPYLNRLNKWSSSGSFLRVMPGGRFDVHRPVYLSHFLRSSAWSRRARARHFGGVARRCDGALTAGCPCCGGRFAFRRGPLCTAHV